MIHRGSSPLQTHISKGADSDQLTRRLTDHIFAITEVPIEIFE